jgi:hypothetical protein
MHAIGIDAFNEGGQAFHRERHVAADRGVTEAVAFESMVTLQTPAQ